jgi:hypothetical protein
VSARRILVTASIVLAACGASADPAKLAGSAPAGWAFADVAVPKGIDLPIVPGGLVLNSYGGSDRVVVTIVYGSAERARIVAAYDDWSSRRNGAKSGRGFDVGARIAWQDSWTAGRSEARMSECLNELSGEFDNLCVALTTGVGSVP